MVDLGRDVLKLVRLAYPTADAATWEVIGINSFLEGLPGPASEMKLQVIKGKLILYRRQWLMPLRWMH